MGEMVFIFYFFFFEKIWMMNFNRFELVESNGERRNVYLFVLLLLLLIL